MTNIKNLQPSESKVLATYCTYKTLYEQKKDTYDIVAGFIKYAVEKDGSLEYSIIDISDLIVKEFGIHIPDYVIKTAIKRLNFIRKYKQMYLVSRQVENPQSHLNEIQNISLQNAGFVFGQLDKYAEENISKKKDDKFDEYLHRLHRCFFRYLMDEGIDEGIDEDMVACVSTFTMKCDSTTQDIINSMRAGHILYCGLKNNDHLDEGGSWKTPLTLFLDMEILFNIAGYNGTIFKRLVDELLSLINDINKKQKYISLRYFTSTKENIKRYFDVAENQFRLKVPSLSKSTAMEEFLNGCKMPSDVLDKESDFFHLLASKSIIEDDYNDYYNKNLSQYNLEGIEIGNEKCRTIHNENEDGIKLEERKKMISHINKRRRGKIFTDYRDCKYLLLTGTIDTLKLAKEIVNEEAKKAGISKSVISYAVSMNTLTNIMWYNSSSKLKTDQKYPSNISCILKAQVVLSSLLGKNISQLYKDAASQYKDKKISKDDFISRILNYKNKEKLPEAINEKNVDEVYALITQNDIKNYEDENKALKNEIHKKDNEIDKLKQQKRDEKSLLDKTRKDALSELSSLKDAETKLLARKEFFQIYLRYFYRIKRLMKRILTGLAIILMISIVIFVYQYGIDTFQSIIGIISIIVTVISFICPDNFHINNIKIKNINDFTGALAKYFVKKKYPKEDISFLKTGNNIDAKIEEIRVRIKNILN